MAGKAEKKGDLGRLAFFGEQRFALAALNALVEAGYTPSQVFTRRLLDPETGKRTRTSPVARWAKRNDVPVKYPEEEDRRQWVKELIADPPDLVLTANWDEPLPTEILDVPRLGCVGLHPSYLPRYRGGEPIRSVLAEGERSTGVTTFQLEDEDWGGPILLQEQVDIEPDETYGELAPRMFELGAQLVVETVDRLAGKGKKIAPKRQDERRASKSPGITRRHRKPPWWLESKDVYNRLRAYLPDQGLEVFIQASRVEIVQGAPVEWLKPTYGDTGTYLGLRSGRLAVLCNNNTVFGIQRLRLKNGDTIAAARFARENDLSIGSSIV